MRVSKTTHFYLSLTGSLLISFLQQLRIYVRFQQGMYRIKVCQSIVTIFSARSQLSYVFGFQQVLHITQRGLYPNISYSLTMHWR